MTEEKESISSQMQQELDRLKAENEMLKLELEGLEKIAEEHRLLHEASFAGIMIHEKGTLLKANDQYYKMFQYSPEELLGKKVLPLTVVPESLDFKTRRTTPEGVTIYEILGKQRNGNTFLMEVRGKEMTFDNRKVRGVSMVDISEQRKTEEALRESEEMLRFLSSRLFLAQEEERSRLSKELHDQLGHDLVLLKTQIRFLCRKTSEDHKEIRQGFESTIGEVDRIIENVRRISRDLKPSVLEDLGLFASLQWLVENFAKQNDLEVSLDMEDIDHLFSREAQVNLYRIFQECLTNIAKHAGASQVNIEVNKEKGQIVFRIQDNGKGFDVKKVLARKFHQKGVGLTAMKERMNILGGKYDVITQPGKGTITRFSLPITEKEV